MRNLISIGTLWAFGLVFSAHDAIADVEKYLDENATYYPPGSPGAYENCKYGQDGCWIIESEPLEGIALALALVGALVFAVSVVAFIIWSNKKNKRQQSLE